MMDFLTGFLVIIIVIGIIYLMGILSNLWSSKIISPSSFSDVMGRGWTVLMIIFVALIIPICVAIFGHIILGFFQGNV